MLHHDMTAVVGDSWYRDPTTQELRLGFNGAATLVPEVLPSTSLPKLSAIFSLPENPTLYPSEIITLSARGVESLGDARREIDLSAEALWESSDPSVASVENRILRAQAPGDVQLRCTARAFQRVQAVAVLPDQPLGERTYFAGLRRTSQIAFDVTDNLYVCNQSRFVHRILRHGGFERILELPDTGFHHNRIDCIAVNHTGDVFVSNLEPTRRIAYFRLNRGGFDPPVLIGPDDGSVKKSIAFTSDGSVVVGIMGNTIDLGEVLQILPDSSCTSFKTRGSAHNLAVGPNNMVYAVSSIKNAVDVYDRSGRLLESIQFPQPSSVGAIAVGADGKIYVALWHPGRIITYNREPTGYAISTIALSADTPSGIAIDSTDALYFSDFQTGRIEYLVRRS
jgi:sugar lactone lactonase YvrE